jgi:SAM-dependent methyltransferase
VDLPFSDEEGFIQYYENYPPVKDSYVEKDYLHDRELAKKRCDVYGVVQGSRMRILDVGSGSGAFVDECRARGAEAYGCEIGVYSYRKGADPFTYHAPFEEVHFPTDHFEMVTCHDVLEHVLDPMSFVKELFRVTTQQGFCKVEIPNFYTEAGAHHWKSTEHIWFFTPEQFVSLATNVGFQVSSVDHPTESKLLFQLFKPAQNRVRVLLPPGIGDAYWSIVKLESIMQKYNFSLPDVFVVCNRDRKYNGNNRAFPFIEMFPFLHSSGVSIGSNEYVDARGLWKEAYAQRGRTIFQKVLGCDYFVSYNGHLRYGEDLDKIDPDLKCDWTPPMFLSLEQENFRRESIKKFGRYISYHFVFQGTYRYWTDQFPIKAVVETINRVTAATGCIPVITGAAWDRDESMLSLVVRNLRGVVDLRGQTTVEQLFGLMRGAEAVVGYPSGSTIMGAVLKKKTLIIWNHYYNNDFAWFCVPPEVRRTTYQIEDTRQLTPVRLEGRILDLLGEKKREPSVPVEPIVLKGKSDIVAVCVLKTGGVFSEQNVLILRDMLKRFLTIDHKFVCLTDSDNLPADIITVPLINKEEKGAWTTMEIFREDLAKTLFKDHLVVYFDLDLLLLDRIDSLIELDHNFTMLSTFVSGRRYGNWATGMMIWHGDYSYLYGVYIENKRRYADDQLVGLFISEHLKEPPNSIQMLHAGIYSYKRDCGITLPPATSMVWFHGRPKYHEAGTPWVVEFLNGLRDQPAKEAA